MYRRMIVSLVAPAIVCVLCIAGLNGCKKSADAAQSGKPATAPAASEESKEAPEHTLANEPGRSFHRARKSFLRRHYRRSADRIRKGASFIRLDTRNAADEARTALTRSAGELEALAGRVEQRNVRSVKMLDDAFARAHYALSRHYYLNAVRRRTDNQTSRLARSLKACVRHLEDGFAWARHPVQGDTLDVIENTERLAQKLDQGMTVSDDQFSRLIDQLGAQIQKLKTLVEPPPA